MPCTSENNFIPGNSGQTDRYCSISISEPDWHYTDKTGVKKWVGTLWQRFICPQAYIQDAVSPHSIYMKSRSQKLRH